MLLCCIIALQAHVAANRAPQRHGGDFAFDGAAFDGIILIEYFQR